MIIAIDGYSATGKSTLASLLAKKIGFKHLNSGLVYRAISYTLLLNGIDKSNFRDSTDKIRELTLAFQIDFEELENNISKLKVPEVGDFGAQIAKLPFIRERVAEVLRAAATNLNIVVEGRDIGTVLFPEADIKFFFKADLTIRAIRLGNERKCNDLASIKKEIEMRDNEDETRKVSPLIRAVDAIDIDTTYISIEETLILLEKKLNEFKK